MSRVTGAALVGVDGVAVEVEVRISSQLPKVDVVAELVGALGVLGTGQGVGAVGAGDTFEAVGEAGNDAVNNANLGGRR